MTPGDLCRVQSARTYLMDQVIHHCWKKWKIEGVCIMELSELSVWYQTIVNIEMYRGGRGGEWGGWLTAGCRSVLEWRFNAQRHFLAAERERRHWRERQNKPWVTTALLYCKVTTHLDDFKWYRKPQQNPSKTWTHTHTQSHKHTHTRPLESNRKHWQVGPSK